MEHESLRTRSPPPLDSPPPPSPRRRYAPYARPGAEAAAKDRTNYHWHTMCNVRNKTMASYDALYTLHRAVKRGEAVTERAIASVLHVMGDVLACGKCGAIIDKLDNTSFVAKCGHVFHKSPTNCWDEAGRSCNLPACRRVNQ